MTEQQGQDAAARLVLEWEAKLYSEYHAYEINEPILADLATRIRSLLAEERQRCCAAVCRHCAAGNPPEQLEEGGWWHKELGFDVTCPAFNIHEEAFLAKERVAGKE